MAKLKKSTWALLIVGFIIMYFFAQQGGGLPSFTGTLVDICTDTSPSNLSSLVTGTFCTAKINDISGSCNLLTEETEDGKQVINGGWSGIGNFRIQDGPYDVGGTSYTSCIRMIEAMDALSPDVSKITTKNSVDIYNITDFVISHGALTNEQRVADVRSFCSGNKNVMIFPVNYTEKDTLLNTYFSNYINCVKKDQCLNSSDECGADYYCDLSTETCKLIDCTGEKKVIINHVCTTVDCTLSSHCIQQEDINCDTKIESKQGSCGSDYKCTFAAPVVCAKTTLIWNKYIGNFLMDKFGKNYEEDKWYIIAGFIMLLVGGLIYGIKQTR